MDIVIKRVYDQPDDADGLRVLVDRLWPRGVTKQKAQVDVWLKDVTPSPELRSWWGHNPDTYPQFTASYREELAKAPASAGLEELVKLARQQEAENQRLTLLYGAKDPQVNHAVVLLQVLHEALK